MSLNNIKKCNFNSRSQFMFDTPALQERNCANQCKMVLSNNICKHIYTEGSGLSRTIMPSSIGNEGSLKFDLEKSIPTSLNLNGSYHFQIYMFMLFCVIYCSPSVHPLFETSCYSSSSFGTSATCISKSKSISVIFL